MHFKIESVLVLKKTTDTPSNDDIKNKENALETEAMR